MANLVTFATDETELSITSRYGSFKFARQFLVFITGSGQAKFLQSIFITPPLFL